MMRDYVAFYEKCLKKYKSEMRWKAFKTAGVYPMRIKSEFREVNNTYIKQRDWVNTTEKVHG